MSAKINIRNSFSGKIDPSQLGMCGDAPLLFGLSISEVPDIKACVDWFISMVGGEYDLYGMDGNCIKLNDMIFEFLEDPDDGYRSHLGAVRIPPDSKKLIFFNRPIAKVKLLNKYVPEDPAEDIMDNFEGYHLIDVEDNHVWCSMGTGNTNDYYPYFVTSWHPKEPKL